MAVQGSVCFQSSQWRQCKLFLQLLAYIIGMRNQVTPFRGEGQRGQMQEEGEGARVSEKGRWAREGVGEWAGGGSGSNEKGIWAREGA